jgi:hypothetical protein
MPFTATRDAIRRSEAVPSHWRANGRATGQHRTSAARCVLPARDSVSGRFPAACPRLASQGSLRIRPRPQQMGDVVTPEPSPQPGAFAMFGALTGIATLSAALVVGGAALGLLVDSWTSAPHVFLFVGLVLGVAAAVLATRSIVRRVFG